MLLIIVLINKIISDAFHWPYFRIIPICTYLSNMTNSKLFEQHQKKEETFGTTEQESSHP